MGTHPVWPGSSGPTWSSLPWFVGPQGDTRSGSATLWVRWLRIGPGAARLPDGRAQQPPHHLGSSTRTCFQLAVIAGRIPGEGRRPPDWRAPLAKPGAREVNNWPAADLWATSPHLAPNFSSSFPFRGYPCGCRPGLNGFGIDTGLK